MKDSVHGMQNYFQYNIFPSSQRRGSVRRYLIYMAALVWIEHLFGKSLAASNVRTCGSFSNKLSSGISLFKRNNNNKHQRLSEEDMQPVEGRKCTTDSQCVQYRSKRFGKNTGGNINFDPHKKGRLGEYTCVNGMCKYLVKAGELCFSANDCAGFHLSKRWGLISSNTTANDPIGSSWCAPDFCTVESTCGGAWTLPGAPDDVPMGANTNKPNKLANMNGSISCCRGFYADSQCAFLSGSIDTCSTGYSCTLLSSNEKSSIHEQNPLLTFNNDSIGFRKSNSNHTKGTKDENSLSLGKCVSEENHQQIWIGVLLVLVGGSTLNVGLNLQKYAFRKRQVRSPNKNTSSDILHLNKSSGSNYLESSQDSDEHDNENGTGLIGSPCFDIQEIAYHDLHPDSSSTPPPPNRHKFGRRTVNTNTNHRNIDKGNKKKTETEAENRSEVPQHNSRMSLTSIKTKLQSIKHKLVLKYSETPFGSPIWIVGLSVFMLGNVVNFIALQFAPQSLVAPLGAVSLVTNVIVAPLLNHEKLSIFDIGGIVLIIAGCIIVVVFSGIVQQDYRLCVLIQLLKTKSTVIYLCLICFAIIATYVFIWVVERGIDKYKTECEFQNIALSVNQKTNNPVSTISHQRYLDVGKVQKDANNSRSHSTAGLLKEPNDGGCGIERITGPEEIRECMIGSDTFLDAEHAINNRTKHKNTSNTRTHKNKLNMNKKRKSKMKFNANDGNLKKRESASSSKDDKNNRSLMQILEVERLVPESADDENIGDIASKDNCAEIPVKSTKRRIRFCHPLNIFDRYIKPIQNDSCRVKYGLPLAYAGLGSLMATLTTLFAKSLVNLLSVSLFDHENQFTDIFAWAILVITGFTAGSQVYWINQGLLRYDALLQVPIFYVVWTVMDIIGGGIYFNEFKWFTPLKYGLFAVGVVVIFSGVGLLSYRLKTL